MLNTVSNKLTDRRYFTCLGAGVYLGPCLYPNRMTTDAEQMQLRQITFEAEELKKRLEADGKGHLFESLKLDPDSYEAPNEHIHTGGCNH